MKKIVCILAFLVSYSIHSQSFNNVEEYGKLHNEYVMFFLNSGKEVSDYKDIDSFIKDYYAIVTKSIPTSMSEEDFVFEFKKTFSNNFNSSGLSVSFKMQLTKMLDEKRISKGVHDKMNEILNSAGQHEKTLLLISELEKLTTTDFEKNSVGVFKSVYNNSYNLWNNYYSTAGKKKGLKPGSWTIIGDAVGAFVFCYIPPVAAAAAGGISLFLHNCEPNCHI